MVVVQNHSISKVCLCFKPVFKVLAEYGEYTHESHRFLCIEHTASICHVFLSILHVLSDLLARECNQVGTIIMPIGQMSKLRLREEKQLAQLTQPPPACALCVHPTSIALCTWQAVVSVAWLAPSPPPMI